MPKVRVTIADVADHVDHIRKVAGAEHVGLGGDYDGNDSWPEGLEDVSDYPRLFAELARRGWSDEDLGRLRERQRPAGAAESRRGGRPPAEGAPGLDRDDRRARRPALRPADRPPPGVAV